MENRQASKATAIATCLKAKVTKEARSFQGLTFSPTFSTLACPLMLSPERVPPSGSLKLYSRLDPIDVSWLLLALYCFTG